MPESALYSQLQEYERQVDACMVQKQAEVQDCMRRPHHLAKKLRLYVYNTHANQEASANQEMSATSSGTAHSQVPVCLLPTAVCRSASFTSRALVSISAPVLRPREHGDTICSRPVMACLDLAIGGSQGQDQQQFHHWCLQQSAALGNAATLFSPHAVRTNAVCSMCSHVAYARLLMQFAQ